MRNETKNDLLRAQASNALLQSLGYTVADSLGQSRRGQWFRATEHASGHVVLVRVAVADEISRETEERILRDWDGVNRVVSSAVVQLKNHGSENGFLYSVFRDQGFVPLALIANLSRQPTMELLCIARSCAEALGTLHNSGIVHGAIDPETVWINRRGMEVQFSDAYAARPTMAGSPDPLQSYEGDVAPEYAAPEMTGRLDARIDRRSDLYCLGGVLYQLFAGRPPFGHVDLLGLIHSHLARDVDAPSDLDPGVPRTVSDILLKLLSKSPSERYQSALGLAYDLRWCEEHLDEAYQGSHLAIGARDASGVLVEPRQLIGRDRELTLLKEIRVNVSFGDTHVVLINGAAGSGKSALARAALSGSGLDGIVATAKADQIKSNEPYALVTQAITEIVQQVLTSSEEKVLSWKKRLTHVLGPGLRVVTDLVPCVELIVGAQPRLPDLPPAESRNRFRTALHAFVRVFCRKDSQLCLFLDDLQWADSASLELLSSLLCEAELSHVLLVAVYRSGKELAAPHLDAAIGSIKTGTCVVHEIQLGGLELSDSARLLSSAMKSDARDTLPLARILHQKTEGNPFFFWQLLQFLQSRGLVTYDYASGRWQWDAARIQVEGVNDSVLALMHHKLDQLPTATRDVLATAALIGATCQIEVVARAMDVQPKALYRLLHPAIDGGLVYLANVDGSKERVPSERNGGDLPIGKLTFRFLHDRVQQAAISRMDDQALRCRRFEIGSRLLSLVKTDSHDAVSFAVVDNLNCASDLVPESGKRSVLAALNRGCCKRARESAAFDQALQYARAGLAMLTESAWHEVYDLCLDLHEQAFECAYITGHFAEADRLFATILANARSRDTKADAYFTRILVATSLDDTDDAMRLGVEGLELFGQRLSAFPSRLSLLIELSRAFLQLRNRPAAALSMLPTMGNQSARNALRLLMSICPVAYYRSPNLMSLAALRIMRLSLTHGNAEESPFGYVLFGLIAGAVLGRYELGQSFGKLAVQLARQGHAPIVCAKVIMIFGGFVSFWRDPIDSSLQLLEESLNLAVSVGDVQYANYSILQTLFLSLARGIPLDEVLTTCRKHKNFIDQTKDEFGIVNRLIRERYIYALKGETSALDSLDGGGFDEATLVTRCREAGNQTTLAYLTVVRTQLAFLAGRYPEAFRLSEEAERSIDALMSQIMVAEHYFFRGLIVGELLASSVANRRRLKRVLARCIARLQTWAGHCSENFGSQHLVLRGVWASQFGSSEEASRSFSDATSMAAKHRVFHVMGIAFELAARHSFKCGLWARGRHEVEGALVAYSAWGATGKVQQLQSGGLRAFEGSGIEQRSGNNSLEGGRRGELDRIALSRFVNVSEKIGSVGESAELLGMLMRHVMECAGASGGCLVALLNEGAELEMVACGLVRNDGIRVSSDPATVSAHGSEQVIRYAIRSGDVIALSSPDNDPRFRACSYIREMHPCSVLCVPLKFGPHMVGALYLENGLLHNAFVLERMPYVSVLAGQLALVLQNVLAFRDLADRSKRLDAATETVGILERVQSHLTKFVPRSVQEDIRADPERMDFPARDEDVTVMFLDIAGYTAMTERVGAREAQAIVERHFSAYMDAAAIHGGEINEIAGDGLMVIFRDRHGADHAQRAVAAAGAIQASSRRLNSVTRDGLPVLIHIGIHSGQATVGAKKIEGKAGIRWTFTATGATTNLAARLVQAAQGGEILISEATAKLLDGRWLLSLKGRRRFKGMGREVKVFEIKDRVNVSEQENAMDGDALRD